MTNEQIFLALALLPLALGALVFTIAYTSAAHRGDGLNDYVLTLAGSAVSQIEPCSGYVHAWWAGSARYQVFTSPSQIRALRLALPVPTRQEKRFTGLRAAPASTITEAQDTVHDACRPDLLESGVWPVVGGKVVV